MVDTSIIARKIHSNVMDTCFNAIVSEAFIGAVPIESSEMTDEMHEKLGAYAAECLTDLGSSKLLTEALESVKNHTSRLSAPEVAYLKQINDICMETAKAVTARIIEENKDDDDALKNAADKVALTQNEFEKFSKAAANVTPDALSKMIQQKTLDTIKEEKEAFQKDKELELEIVNAINAVSEDDAGEELPPEMGDIAEPPKEGAEIGQNAAPQNEEPQLEEPAEGNGSESFGYSTRKAMESYVGVDKKVTEDAMDAFMRSVAGQNYRRKHSSIFSRLQELAYEGVLATTEQYDAIPFDTMAAITKENTFGRFNSHRTKDLKVTMESVSRYNFESVGTPDGPSKEQLSNGLLVASIIYTFFETLNSMNLFCPKLAEIREFVDETLPIKDRVALDKKQFMEFFKSVMANAQQQLRGMSTVPDVDVIQKDLDVVREHVQTHGFDDVRDEVNEAIESLQKAIDTKRDAIIAASRPAPKVEESAYESMMRTTDTLKFTRVANISGRKSNVASFRCKVDPTSKYVAMEALNVAGVPVGRSTIVLESRIPKDGLVDFVTSAIRASKLPTLGKRVVVSDKRNGKIYMDTAKD